MEYLICLALGFAAGAAVFAMAVKRAAKKPEGKTALLVSVILSGPGPWRPPK